MAPTVCVAEFPMMGTTVSAHTRRRRGPQNAAKRRRFALEEMLRTGTFVETLLPPRENCSRRLDCANAVSDRSITDKNGRYPTNMDEHHKRQAERRKDLLSIVVRTIILVHRNRILQKRLNMLRAEMQRFLRSVLNNPENQCQQRRSQTSSYSEDSSSYSEDSSSYSEDSSSTEKVVSTLSPALGPDSTRNSFHGVTSARDNRDYTNDESSSPDVNPKIQPGGNVDFSGPRD